MDTKIENIDYKVRLDKALQVNEAQQLTIQNLQLQILQLKKLVLEAGMKSLWELAIKPHPHFLM
jgi:hypothetical protein